MLRKIQRQAIKAWEKTKNGVVVIPTGSGKNLPLIIVKLY